MQDSMPSDLILSKQFFNNIDDILTINL